MSETRQRLNALSAFKIVNNLTSALLDELELLAGACSRATLGQNCEDVLGEYYRKAGKLNSVYFATPFDASEVGLLVVVRTELFEGKTSIYLR